MTEQEQLDHIVDDVLSAREQAVSAREKFLVELLDIVLLAAAERLVETETCEARSAGIFLAGSAAVAGSAGKNGRKARRRSAH